MNESWIIIEPKEKFDFYEHINKAIILSYNQTRLWQVELFLFQILKDTRSRALLEDQASIILGKAGKDFEFGDLANKVSQIKFALGFL